MKRPLKLGAGFVFALYLALGPFVYPRQPQTLPMASWSVQDIESRNR